MSFVQINEYHVNVDHIIYVQDTGKRLHVGFTAPSGKEIILTVDKGTEQAAKIMKAISERC